jgi:hypothetical protein
MNGYSLPLVLGNRLSPLLEGLGPPPARPRPGPGGSRPRRTNSARTTSRPETRISRRTGGPPPTPHHVLGTRRTQLSTRTTPAPDAAGPTGASGDSDTYTKERRNKDVRAGRPGMTIPANLNATEGRRAGQPPRPKPRPTGRKPDSRKSATQLPTRTRTGTRTGPRGKIFQVNYPNELNAYQPGGPDSDSNFMEYSTETTDGQFQTCTRFAPCNKFGIDPLRTETCYQHEHNQAPQADVKFRNPSLPSVASPIPHPCALLLHLHATPLR